MYLYYEYAIVVNKPWAKKLGEQVIKKFLYKKNKAKDVGLAAASGAKSTRTRYIWFAGIVML